MKKMKISKAGLELIKSFEGFSSKPYRCPAGVATIGYGTTHYEDRAVAMDDPSISKRTASYLLESQVNETYGKAVNHYVTEDITQNQYDAMVSFAYNLGSGALKSSTLLKKVNQGKMKRASREFLKWDHAGGKRLAGLTRRRKAESELFLA